MYIVAYNCTEPHLHEDFIMEYSTVPGTLLQLYSEYKTVWSDEVDT
jgi:hypothetical protein